MTPSNAPCNPPVYPSGKRIPRRDEGYVGLDLPPGEGGGSFPCVLMEPQHNGIVPCL
jgi:hypothetical protein